MPQPYDLSVDRAAALILIVPPAFLLLVMPSDWSPMSLFLAVLTWSFPFGVFVGIGINWLFLLREGRDAVWEFDDVGASLWWPGKRARVVWSDIERIDAVPRRWQVCPHIVFRPSDVDGRPKVLSVRTWRARKDSLAVLAQQIAAHVPADRVSARFSQWSDSVTPGSR